MKVVWTVRSTAEATQSNTFGPLIALGIDGAKVTFPERWVNDVFIYNLNLAEGLPFRSFEEFKGYIKGEITREFGNSSLQTFLNHCDDKPRLHLPGTIQENILYSIPKHDITEAFFGSIVGNTKKNFVGKQMIAEIPDAPGAAAAQAAAAPTTGARAAPAAAAMRSPEGGTTGQTQATPARAAQGNSRLHELIKLGYKPAQLRLASSIINDNPTITIEQLIDVMVGGKRRKTRHKRKAKKTMKRRKLKRRG